MFLPGKGKDVLLASIGDLFFGSGDLLGRYSAAVLAGAIGGFVAYWRNASRIKREGAKPHLPIEEIIRTDRMITEHLTRLMMTLGPCCIRVYLTKFHNGDRYIDDSDILKKSRTHEVTADGVSYQAHAFQALLTSSVPEEMDLVLEQGPSWRMVDDLPNDPGLFKWLCVQGNVSAIARAKVHKGRAIVGFIGADFRCDGSSKPPANINEMVECAGRIGAILSIERGHGR